MIKISEIGLNHMGQDKELFKYLYYLKREKIYGITIQILRNNFYKKKKFKRFKLKINSIVKFIKEVKKSKKKVGLAIDDINQIKFFEKLKIDFYKVLSKDFKNIKLIKKLTKTKAKFIYLPTGLSSYKEIAKILNRINLKKIILIHTSFDEKLKNINFNRIKELRARFNVPVAYGNHSKFLSSIYKSISFKPHAIFFYVKLNRNLNYPDNKHAFKVKNIKKLVSKIDYNFNLIKKI